MIDDVVVFLRALGVDVDAADPLLNIVVNHVIQTILNNTNQPAAPEELLLVAIYMAAGQYLGMMKATGKLEGIDLDAVEKQIKVGDTTVSYAIGDGNQTPEQRLDSLILYLSNYGQEQFAAFRRLKW